MEPLSMAAAAASSAVAIARAAGLGSWIKSTFDGAPGARTAERIVDLAAAAVGASDPEDALKRIRHDAEAREDAKRLLLHWEQELVELQAQDLADARRMYGAQHAMADRLANRIMTWNLPAIVVLVGANCGAVYCIDNPTIAVALGNIIGASVTYLWQERSQVVGFFFGSSMGSKDKNDLLRGRAA